MARKIEISEAQEAVLQDLTGHASHKAHAAIRDACQLVDQTALAYSISINVIGALLCTAARMVPGRKSPAQKIAIALEHLAEVMAHHAKDCE